MKKILFTITGVTALALGIIGMILPVLPTTPLLLLALYCFTKGSERLSTWFKESSIYKKYLSEYVQKKTLSLKQKFFIQMFAGIMMIISFLLVDVNIVRIILAVAFVVHNYIFIFVIKTCPEKKNTKSSMTDLSSPSQLQ